MEKEERATVDADEMLYRPEVKPLRVGQLRTGPIGLPEYLPLTVHVAGKPGGDAVGEQIVIGAGIGVLDSGVQRGEEVGQHVAVGCEFAPGECAQRPR